MVNHRIILAFLTGTVVLLILLRVQGSSLVNEQAPAGIVSFELAGSRTKAEAISSAWESEGRTKTALGNIRLDYLFIPFYSLFLYMSCGTLATGSSSRSRRPGVWIAFGSLLAGMLDVFENLVMSAQIKGGISNAGVLATYLLASAKFVLVGAAFIYILVQGTRLLISRSGKSGSPA
jgi:hypothetical protein